MSVNRVILVGNASKNAEIKYTASGTPVCRFSLATNERFKNKAGEVEQHTEWHSIVAWGKLAEICGQVITKGKLCYVEGSIRTGKWQDQNGNERKFCDIVASQMRMLSASSSGNGPAPQSGASQNATQSSDEDNPFEADPSDVPF